MNVELGGVDDHVGKLANRLHNAAFVAKTFPNGERLAKRMRPARFAETAE